MSKIKDLIEKYCPNGVEYKELGDVATISSGNSAPQDKELFIDGTFPFCRTSDVGKVHLSNNFSQIKDRLNEKGIKGMTLFPKETILFPKSGASTFLNHRVMLSVESYVSSHLATIYRKEGKILSNYLYHFLTTIDAQTLVGDTDYPALKISDISKKIIVPVPPLPVQEEIVRILDNFTELEARRKQYEYYRNKLLSFNKIGGGTQRQVKWVKMSEIGTYRTKRVPAATLNAGNYIGVENLLQNRLGKIDSSCVPTTGNFIGYKIGDVLIGNIRPYLKKIWFADTDGGTNGDVLAIHINDISANIILPKFLYYILASDTFFAYDMQYAKGAKMPRGDKNAVMNYVIPIPSITEQERIIAILDKFDALVNDISAGLPAEIEARRKQYEYYRNKLLTFKKIA